MARYGRTRAREGRLPEQAAPSTPEDASSGNRKARREWDLRDILYVLTAVGVGLIVVWCAALALPPFTGKRVVWAVAVTVVLLLNGSLGALVIGGYIELRHKEWSRLRGPVDLLFVYGALAVVAVGDVSFSWWLFATTQSESRWLFLAIAALGLAAGGWHSWQRLWPHHEDSGEQRWTLFGLLSALLGFGLGSILAIASLATSAYWHNAEQQTGHRVPLVAGIQGPYLALGDSYSAGEGLGPPWGAGTDGVACHRSVKQAYAQLLISREGPLLKPTDFTACSGAIVADIFKGTTRHGIHVPPQVDGKVHRDVHLLTLTIGGNNVLFSKIVTFCFEEAHCLSATFPPPGMSSGPEHVKPGPLATSWAPAAALAAGKEDAVVFRKLRQDFPNARIVVVGYPYLFPEGKR